MGRFCLTVFLPIFLSCVFLSYQLVPNEVSADPTTPTAKTQPVLTCVNQRDGVLTPAATCTNGKRLAGCCVERTYCDYNSSSTDFTLYAYKGYKETCESTYVCCPLDYVLPVVTNDVSNGFDDDDK